MMLTSDKTLNYEFYEKLTTVLTDIKDNKEIPKYLNGQTGTEDNNDVIRKHGESATNNNGMRLRQLFGSMSLKVMKRYFPHKDIHKFIWLQATKGQRTEVYNN